MISTQNIEGELYEVDDVRLKVFDDLENHPRMYERREVTVTTELGNTGLKSLIQAQAYFLVQYQPHLLDLPVMRSYADLMDGKKYYLPRDRDVPAPAWWYEVHTGYEKL